jgi:hypothetical protein
MEHTCNFALTSFLSRTENNITHCMCVLEASYHPEDGGSMFLRNITRYQTTPYHSPEDYNVNQMPWNQ